MSKNAYLRPIAPAQDKENAPLCLTALSCRQEVKPYTLQPGVVNVEAGILTRHFLEKLLSLSDHNTQINCATSSHKRTREGSNTLHRSDGLCYGLICKPNACSSPHKQNPSRKHELKWQPEGALLFGSAGYSTWQTWFWELISSKKRNAACFA